MQAPPRPQTAQNALGVARMRSVAWRAYAPLVAAEPMIKHLAAVAKQARESADPKRKIIHIAVVADVDPSTIWRFEKGRWPKDADKLIAGYATELEIDPIELWMRAISRWLEEESPNAEAAARLVAVLREADQRSGEWPQEEPRARGSARAAR